MVFNGDQSLATEFKGKDNSDVSPRLGMQSQFEIFQTESSYIVTNPISGKEEIFRVKK